MSADINKLLGLTLSDVIVDREDDKVYFNVDNGDIYTLYHSQDCCEHVRIEDVNGDVSDLVGAPITQAELSTNNEDRMDIASDDSFTWSFYKLATIKGYVTIRWLGESNGYYSEEVDFYKTSSK